MPFVRVVMELTGGAFLGACVYIALVQQPARVALGGVRAIEDFRAAIPRAEKLQAPLLVVCLVSAVVVLASAFSWSVAAGAALMLVVLVQTILTVLPINRRLLAGQASEHLGDAEAAIVRWGHLHAVRTVITLGGATALML